MSEEISAPGWQAIDAALGRVYPGQLPHQFTSATPYELDTPSPLPAVSVWEAASPCSWHYVGYGLSELFEKDSGLPDVSGFGIELTFRLPRIPGDQRPPALGVRLIQALGHHCLEQRAGLDSGHCIDLGGPLDPDHPAGPSALICVPDPMLRTIHTPHGRVLFLQLVGLFADELSLFRTLDLPAKVSALADLDPAGTTDPARACWFDDVEQVKVLRRAKLGVGTG
jgi:hypothetical protein